MNIKDLTDQEKSELLIKRIGEGGEPMLLFGNHLHFTKPDYDDLDDLYKLDRHGNPLHLPQAWRVLNWAYAVLEDQGRHHMFLDWWIIANLHVKSLSVAMRLWLDKILELAIEAGIVELDKETEQ